MMVAESVLNKKSPVRHLSRFLMCPTTGIAYDEPAPNLFSFNSPYGACVRCNGLGEVLEIDLNKIIPNPEVSIKKGGIAPLGPYKDNWIFRQIEAIGKVYGFDLNTPVGEIDDEAMNVLLYGTSEMIRIKEATGGTNSFAFEGIASFISSQLNDESSKAIEKWAHSFMQHKVCPECHGTRLKKESLYFRIDGKNIAELSQLDIRELQLFLESLERKGLSPNISKK